jgi:biopolymer transport protein ExbD
MLKTSSKVESGFSMSSMTDIVFLLLLFFVMASTMMSPSNAIKINLPQSKTATYTKQVVAKVSIDEQGNFFVSQGAEKPRQIAPEALEAAIMNIAAQDSSSYIALYADQSIAYREVVRVLDIANQNKLKIVIATKKAK